MSWLPIAISLTALGVSVLTAWFTLLRRGELKMTQPTVVYLGADGGASGEHRDRAKVFLRTLLYSTARRGQTIESMYVTVQRGESRQNFPIWVYGERNNLMRGSGLFVPWEGIACNHHFLLMACGIGADAQKRNLREWARDLAAREPNGTLNLPAAPDEHSVRSIDDLVRQSEVVLTGRLIAKGSYLTDDNADVLTDYIISDSAVVAGKLASPSAAVPGQMSPAILTVWGGEVAVDGIRIRAVDENRHPITSGRAYLLFLNPLRTAPHTGRYEIHYGAIFEIDAKEVKPLLKRGDAVFPRAAATQTSELIRLVKVAAKAR